MSRRVLLVAYYVPPAGGPATQRILQFIEHLPETGWEVDVLTVREGAYPNRDPSLLAAVPASVTIHRTPSFDPIALYARLRGGGTDAIPAGSLGEASSLLEQAARWIRANVFLPDARVGWWPFAVWRGRRLLRQRAYNAVVSSGAPHSVHLIGRSLHRATGTPWIADLHDPWTDISYYDEFPHTQWAKRLDARLERSVLAEASTVTTVSPSWAELFAGKAPNRHAVVENGFDPSDFEALSPAPADAFVLAHVGKLYASRNPTALWRALARLRDDGRIPPDRRGGPDGATRHRSPRPGPTRDGGGLCAARRGAPAYGSQHAAPADHRTICAGGGHDDQQALRVPRQWPSGAGRGAVGRRRGRAPAPPRRGNGRRVGRCGPPRGTDCGAVRGVGTGRSGRWGDLGGHSAA